MRDESRETQLIGPPTSVPDHRLSIWTIRTEWIGWFYLLLALHAAPLIYALWWSENYRGTHDNIASTITAVVGGSASLIFVAATASVIELEVVMVLKTLLERHFEKKDREKLETEKERERLRAEFERGVEQGIERGIEKGRQLEREEQAARSNGNNGNGNQEG